MKAPPFFLSILLLIGTACQHQPAETTAPPVLPAALPPAAPVAAKLTIAQQFSPIISGSWVSADYLDEVARTRSPEKAFDHTPPAPSSLAIMSFVNKQDSVKIGASYGLHEGGNLTLLLQATSASNALNLREPYTGKTDEISELSYLITTTDTTLFYSTRNSKTRQLINKAVYRRTGNAAAANDLETGLTRGVNRLLLAGHYGGADSVNHSIRVAFSADGTLEGLPFRRYLIQTDFAGPNLGNTVIFDVYTKNRQEFAASFGRDTLRLYTINAAFGVPPGSVDTTELFTRGRLRYQLVRIR